MPVPQTGPFAVGYTLAEVENGIPFLRPMRRWRTTCGYCLLAASVGFVYWHPLAFGSAVAAIVSGLLAIAYMGRAASAELGAGYATRRVVLAVALSALGLIGVWVVSALVESELSKRRLFEGRERARA